MSDRSKAAAADGAHQMHQRWWAPRALLAPPPSVAVAPLSSSQEHAAAPPSQQPMRSHAPLVLRVLQLTLVLAIASVCRRVVIHTNKHSGVLDSALQPRQQWEQYEDGGVLKTAAGGDMSPSGAQGDWSEYECVAWRVASSTCAASDRSADHLQVQSRGCDESISLKQHTSNGGFCELRHKRTGASKQVLMTQAPCYNSNDTQHHTDDGGSHRNSFKCVDFRAYLTFAQRAANFKFDPDFSFGKCRQRLIDDQVSVNRIRYASAHQIPFQKGIAIVHQSSSDLESVYESIQRLRRTGCTLPIEFWYTPESESEDEAQQTQAFLQKMTKTLGVYLRTTKSEDSDDASAFEGPFAKAHAAFYSAFDKVLVLDGLGSLAALITSGNPAHLFSAKAFISTGAIFWQDEYHTEQTSISSFMQTLFGLPSSAGATLFPQDTGRLLIDRRRHLKALNTLMYYVKNYNQIDSLLQIVDSEKDLYQIAWTASSSAFHVTTTTSSPVDPDSQVYTT